MKKVVTMLLSAAMLVGIAGGCGSEKKKRDGEGVTLRWVMPGPGKQSDSDAVWAEFNKRLKTYDGLENVSVDFEVIPASDYSQKFLLMQTGSDDLDIVQTYTLDFAKEARNESFAPMNELIEKNAPDLKKELPEFVLDYGIVDGEIYQIPNYQMIPGLFTLRVNKELADKYMDINELRETMKEYGSSQKSLDIIEAFLAKAKENGELGKGFGPGYASILVSGNYDSIINGFGYNKTDDTNKIVGIHREEEMKKFYDRMHDFFQKGYIRKDILSATDVNKEDGKKDGQIVYFHNGYNGEETDITSNGDEVYVIYANPNPYVGTINAAGGLAIADKSENKETAIKVIELMNTQKGKELYNLLVWGIEGKNYNKIGGDRIETVGYEGQGTANAPYGLWKWVVGNTKNAYLTQKDLDNYKTFVFDELNEGENTRYSNIIGFKPDVSKIEVKTSQLSACIKEYHNPLCYGALDNYENVYNEFMEKLNACGADEIITELQKQVDEFKKEKK